MIILVRHGEATHHTEHLTGGWTNSALTEKGKGQLLSVAKKLAKDFQGRNIEYRILASDLERAADSAEIIARVLGNGVHVEKMQALREKNNGKAAGLLESEARKLYQQPPTLREIHHRNYPEGETRKEFFDRNVNGLKALVDWDKENLIIVAHKGTIQNIIFAWMGLDIKTVNDLVFSVDIQPASVTVLGINKWHEHAIFKLNDVTYKDETTDYGIFDFKYGS